MHRVTGGAVVSASAENIDGLGSIPTDHQFFHLDLWAGISHHLPTSIVRTLRLIITVGDKFFLLKVTESRNLTFAFKKYGNVEVINARSLLQRI